MAVTCGVPQGSVIGPLLWNIFYDDLLRLKQPDGVQLIGFADDIAILGTAHTTDLLEEAMNPALAMVAEWVNNNGLCISIAKTQAIMLTTKRAFRNPDFWLQGTQLELRNHVRYLGVELSSTLGYKTHLSLVSGKAEKTATALSRIMPNVGGPKYSRRKLLATVVENQLLYAAPIWSGALIFQNHRQMILAPQRRMAIRVASAYRTVPTDAILVVAGFTPIHLAARGRAEARRLSGSAYGMEKRMAKRLAEERVVHWWQAEWEERTETGKWTRRLIPNVARWIKRRHGRIGYHMTQFLIGHGCFQSYLHRFARVDSAECVSCGDMTDDAEHTFFICGRWAAKKREMEFMLGEDFTPDTAVPLMLRDMASWARIEKYIDSILCVKEEEEVARQQN